MDELLVRVQRPGAASILMQRISGALKSSFLLSKRLTEEVFQSTIFQSPWEMFNFGWNSFQPHTAPAPAQCRLGCRHRAPPARRPHQPPVGCSTVAGKLPKPAFEDWPVNPAGSSWVLSQLSPGYFHWHSLGRTLWVFVIHNAFSSSTPSQGEHCFWNTYFCLSRAVLLVTFPSFALLFFVAHRLLSLEPAV